MKSFFNLVQEVLKPGLCYRCGGCVTFCTAINYGALGINEDGKPFYRDMEKCTECGICYSICPEIHEMDEEVKRKAAWSEPIGRVIEATVVRSTDTLVRDRASDGGAVTGLLLHLFDRNRIDGAIVTRSVGKYQRHQPFLATTREEILASAGLFIDTSHGMKRFSDQYTTLSTVKEFDPMIKKGLNRVVLVGTPCQIKSLRKMKALNLIPSDSIKICFGLFCSGNYSFGVKEQQKLADIAGVSWGDVAGIKLKDKIIITLKTGKTKTVDLSQMDFMKRFACHHCSDYSSEFADISFGGLGAKKGWTTVITGTPLGRAILADSRSFKNMEQLNVKDNPEYATHALHEVRKASAAKKKKARYARRNLEGRSVEVKV